MKKEKRVKGINSIIEIINMGIQRFNLPKGFYG